MLNTRSFININNKNRRGNYHLGMCGKPKLGSYSFLKTELSKNLTSVQTVFQQKLHAISHSDKKLIEVTLPALNVQIKNVLKHDRNRV